MPPSLPQTGKRRNPWWLGVAAYGLLVFIVSVIPMDVEPSVGRLDKVAHLCEYLLFAWLLVQAIRANRLAQREYLWLAWIYATSYGLLIELIQGLIPWRSADILDAAANALGAALGVWMGRKIPREVKSGTQRGTNISDFTFHF